MNEKELRSARDETTPYERLVTLTSSSYADVRRAVAYRFGDLLARHILTEHLSNGAAAQVQMTNQYRCLDSITIDIPIDVDKGLHWIFTLADPEFNDELLNSELFFGIVGGRTAPDGVPYWTEFEFRNSCPDWGDVESMMENEGYGELLQLPPSWPQPLNGHCYSLWALFELQSQAQVDSSGATTYLRAQESLPVVGTCSVHLRDGLSSTTNGGPIHISSGSQIVHMLNYVRSGDFGDDSEQSASELHTWTREIVEPMLVANPGTPESVLKFISEDPTSPALNLMRVCPWIPQEIRLLATEASPCALYEISNYAGEASSDSQGSELQPEDLFYSNESGHKLSDVQLITEVTELRESIESLASNWGDHEPDELSVDFLISAHKQFLQCCFWLRTPSACDAGLIGVTKETLLEWKTALTKLLSSLETDRNLPFIEELSHGSWLDGEEEQALHEHREAQSLMEVAQEQLLAGDIDSARENIRGAIEAGDTNARYLLTLVEAREGDEVSYRTALTEAVEAGSIHALGDLATIQLSEGRFDHVAELMKEVAIFDRTAGVWSSMAWALLMTDRISEYLAQVDDHTLERLIQQPAPFRLAGQLRRELNFFANHFHCVSQVRELTEYERSILDSILSDYENESEIVLIAANICFSHDDQSGCNQLLSRLSEQDTDELIEEFTSALVEVPEGSQAHKYFTQLLFLLTRS